MGGGGVVGLEPSFWSRCQQNVPPPGRGRDLRSSGVWAPTFWETSAPNGPEQMICKCALDESCRVSTLKPFSYRLRACNSSVEATVRLVRGTKRRPEENLTNWSRRLFLAPPGPSHPGGMRTSNRGTRPCLAAGETPETGVRKINTRALLGVAGEAAPRLAAAAAAAWVPCVMSKTVRTVSVHVSVRYLRHMEALGASSPWTDESANLLFRVYFSG